MAENEIIDLGHATRWARTRRALKDPDCPLHEVAAAMARDMERVLRALARILRSGPSLAELLRLALGSSFAVQKVIAQFQERSLASLVNDARNRCLSNDPDLVAAVAARLMIERLTDQAEGRAARHTHYQDAMSRDELHAQVQQTFAAYEGNLRDMLAAALREGEPVRFKPRLTARPRLTPKQVVGMSLLSGNPTRAEGTHVH